MSRLDRDEIVQTAATLFAARGYTTVSVADIIDQLGCTPPRLYRRFPSKLALLHAVLAAAITRQECTGCDLDKYIAAALKAAVDSPDLVIVYARDRRWISPIEFGDVARRATDHDTGWRTAIIAVAPSLTPFAVMIRHQAISAIIAASAVAPRVAGGARLRAAFTVGMHNMITAPYTTVDSAPSLARRWHVRPTRRQEILDAAITLFGERGYEDVRVDDVGKAVGIAGPSVFQHFTTKQQILVAAFDRGITQLMIAASTALDSSNNAEDALQRLVSGLAETAARNRNLLSVLVREAGGLDEPDRERIGRLRRDYDDIWAAVISQIWEELNADTAQAIARAGSEAVLSGLGFADYPSAAVDLATSTLTFITSTASTFENSLQRRVPTTAPIQTRPILDVVELNQKKS
ncbi:TetR/AcrR family transcriptional regulator [Rhodococcus sp. KBS0724]|uniref:TetR/AcrR family transcriptional regulator n=1 Tax=Rhodococcus sp. KBS0724 TaxID=1179674 RepID=UPI00163D5B38|nr:TetR/AcrR family transcriptional regulator [Rhodococcus sp. KBS0724]